MTGEIKPEGTQVSTPTGLRLKREGDNIAVFWNAQPVKMFSHFELWYKENAEGSWVCIYRGPSNRYKHENLDDGTHYYKVRAVDKNWNKSDFCTEESLTFDVTSKCEAPGGLKATREYDNITLTWYENTEQELDHYRIYRKKDDGNWYCIARISTKRQVSVIFVDYHLPAGTYYYKITAVDWYNKESGYSDEVSIEMPDFPKEPQNLELDVSTTESSVSFSAPVTKILIQNTGGQDVLFRFKNTGDYQTLPSKAIFNESGKDEITKVYAKTETGTSHLHITGGN